MSVQAAIGDIVLSWSVAFAIAGFIALALDCGGIAVVLFAIAGGLLVTALFILALTLWVAVGNGRSQRQNTPSSPARGGSGSSRSASMRSSTDSNPSPS